MKIQIEEDSLLIVPETDFEEEWCAEFIPHGEKAIAFLKCGLSSLNIIGIKINRFKGD